MGRLKQKKIYVQNDILILGNAVVEAGEIHANHVHILENAIVNADIYSSSLAISSTATYNGKHQTIEQKIE